MRHQTELGGASAGSSRTARLDPLALPVRFTANDAVADERVRHVELHPERVILRRAVQGMRIALNVPVQAFRGAAVVQFLGHRGERPSQQGIDIHASRLSIITRIALDIIDPGRLAEPRRGAQPGPGS